MKSAAALRSMAHLVSKHWRTQSEPENQYWESVAALEHSCTAGSMNVPYFMSHPSRYVELALIPLAVGGCVRARDNSAQRPRQLVGGTASQLPQRSAVEPAAPQSRSNASPVNEVGGPGDSGAGAMATTPLAREGTYWPFDPLPTRIGNIGQGDRTVYVSVGACNHWNCQVTVSLTPACQDARETDPCVFGRFLFETVFGEFNPLEGRAVRLHRKIVGHLNRQQEYLGGTSIAWDLPGDGAIYEVMLRSGREDYLITLANVFIDSQRR